MADARMANVDDDAPEAAMFHSTSKQRDQMKGDTMQLKGDTAEGRDDRKASGMTEVPLHSPGAAAGQQQAAPIIDSSAESQDQLGGGVVLKKSILEVCLGEAFFKKESWFEGQTSAFVAVAAQLILYGLVMGGLFSASSRDVSCFGGIAIGAGLFYCLVQYKYAKEWGQENFCNDFSWHRDNLFLPLYLEAFAIVFAMWGLLAMLSPNLGQIGQVEASQLTGLGMASFVIITICIFPVVGLGFLLAEMHINRVGLKWNCCDRDVDHHISIPARVRGTFSTGFYKKQCHDCLENRQSGSCFPIIGLTYALSVTLFLIFSALAITRPDLKKKLDGWTVTLIILYCLIFLLILNYGKDAVVGSSLTGWNRENILFPPQLTVFCVVFYFISLACLFLGYRGELFKDGWDRLGGGQRTIWCFIVILAIIVIIVMNMLTGAHLAWWKKLTMKETLNHLKTSSRWKAWGRTEDGKLLKFEIEDEAFYAQHSTNFHCVIS
eukprot:g23879.t1